MIDKENIEKFLEGRDDQKYIVNIITPSYTNKAYVVVRNPNTKKKDIETHYYKPFMWVDPNFFHDTILNTDDKKELKDRKYRLQQEMSKRGVTAKGLYTKDENGYEPERVKNGYTNILHCSVSWSNLINFINHDINNLRKEFDIDHTNKVDMFSNDYKGYFLRVKPVEQFMIQTGKRLFKGFDDYEDLQKFYFDLETSGIDSYNDRIFQIGVRDSEGYDGNGYEEIIEVKGDTPEELRNSERDAIKRFFKLIDEFKPDIISGYNSENFDWPFIEGRCDVLKLDIQEITKPYTPVNKKKCYDKRDNTLKLGNEKEEYKQTYIEGYNILDTSHAVRKAKAINSDIKSWGLKYITQYSGAQKPNRVYIPGDQLYPIWSDSENLYGFNDENGDWYKLDDINDDPKEGYEKVSGAYLVERYLKDDLWETEKVDDIFSQATFLLGKIIPTDYMRNCTMGGSGTWKLILLTWSYEQNLAVPQYEPKKDFPGGLSRMLLIGRSENIVKLDYSALYPRTELTHDIFPNLDISGVMKGLLEYMVNTRDEYKGLKGKYGKLADEVEEQMEKEGLSDNELNELKQKHKEYKDLSSLYDKQQLPLKILANSFFGSFGAPYLFPWGETICAGETTCRGRQYLRLMIDFFDKRGYTPLVCDTDGANFSIPDDADKRTYIPEGTHPETEGDEGKELTGLEADVAEFNETYMIGYMGLDVDELAEAEINFSKKNYATLQDGKVKKTGNTLKSDILEGYIADFLDEGLELLLKGQGYEFIQRYYQLVEDLYNYRVPISKIASKNKVKLTRSQYEQYCQETKSDGTPNSRQAWMELIEQYDLDVKLGDVIYYYNNGTAKSHGDIAKKTNKETGEVEINLNCELVDNNIIENHPDTKHTDYNVPKYIDKLNKRIKPLLVCFHPDIRDEIPIGVKKDRKTKQYVLSEKREFTKKECELVSGHPFKDKDQDDLYEDLYKMEDQEIDFWLNSIQKIPNNIDKDVWEGTKQEYIESLGDTLTKEKRKFEDIIQGLELNELEEAKQHGYLPYRLNNGFMMEDGEILTKDGKNKIADFNEIFKYEEEAKERSKYYQEHKKQNGNKYEHWKVDKLDKQLDGHTIVDEVIDDSDILSDIKMKPNNISLIKQGKKKATSRTFFLNNGLHRIQQDGTVLELKGKYVDHISELKDPEKWAKAEGYDSLEDMRENCSFDHTREFIEGNRGLYIYQIKNVYPN